MFTDPNFKSILCVDMHTTGEPTSIIHEGFPELCGTLLEQRFQAMRDFDHVRTRLMLEPRGYCLVKSSELYQISRACSPPLHSSISICS